MTASEQTLIPSLRSERETVVRKNRQLPLAGMILVLVGEEVTERSVVGQTLLPGDLHLLRISEKMGLEPVEVCAALAQQGVIGGKQVMVGDLLAEHRGLFGLLRTTYHSPVSGVVEFVSPETGHVGIREPSKPIELRAYITGRVVQVEEGRSVVVEAVGGYIQGIFGVGGECSGVITVVESSDTLHASQLPESLTGAIVITRGRPGEGCLAQAALRGAVGFVCGSIDDAALRSYLGYDLGLAITGDEDLSMTVIVTEGFGALPMATGTYSLFQEFAGKSASMNGATQVRAGAVRPEVIIPRASQGVGVTAPLKALSLSVGCTVRLIRVPYFGLTAKVVELPHQPQQIPTGAMARVARVQLATGEVVTVPRANVEVMSS